MFELRLANWDGSADFVPNDEDISGTDWNKLVPNKNRKKTEGEIPAPILDEMMNALGHEGRRISLLKIDCEGCEFAHFGAFVGKDAALWPYVDQMQIEIHVLTRVSPVTNNRSTNGRRGTEWAIPESWWFNMLNLFEDHFHLTLFHMEMNIVAPTCFFEAAFLQRDPETVVVEGGNLAAGIGGLPQSSARIPVWEQPTFPPNMTLT
eukprot:Trichotokara_eunicae@DN6330_c0_g1_i2.p1